MNIPAKCPVCGCVYVTRTKQEDVFECHGCERHFQSVETDDPVPTL